MRVPPARPPPRPPIHVGGTSGRGSYRPQAAASTRAHSEEEKEERHRFIFYSVDRKSKFDNNANWCTALGEWMRKKADGTWVKTGKTDQFEGNFPCVDAERQLVHGMCFTVPPSLVTRCRGFKSMEKFKVAGVEALHSFDFVTAMLLAGQDNPSVNGQLQAFLLLEAFPTGGAYDYLREGAPCEGEHHAFAESAHGETGILKSFRALEDYINTVGRFGQFLDFPSQQGVLSTLRQQDVVATPYAVAGLPFAKAAKSRPIEIADRIAKHLGNPSSAEDRIEAYAAMAIRELDRKEGGYWHDRHVVVDATIDLLKRSAAWSDVDDGDEVAAAVHKAMSGTGVPAALEEDNACLALRFNADNERKLAAAIHAIGSNGRRDTGPKLAKFANPSTDAFGGIVALAAPAARAPNLSKKRTPTPVAAAAPQVDRTSLADEKARLDATQASVVTTLLERGVACLVGGAGVGKTTTVRFVARFMASLGLNVSLCAPTHQAVKRMKAVVGSGVGEFRTMHSLAFDPNALPQVLIIDETSMADMAIALKLLGPKQEALEYVLFVGDDNQLPSVGCGAVLRDIVRSTIVPVVRLSTIYRQQGAGAAIALEAPLIPAGTFSVSERPEGDLSITYADTSDDTALRTIVDAYVTAVTKGGEDNLKNVQMIATRNVTVDALNQLARDRLNPYDFAQGGEYLPDDQPNHEEGDKAKRISWRVKDIVVAIDTVKQEEGPAEKTTASRSQKAAKESKAKVLNGDRGQVVRLYSERDKEYVEVRFESGITHRYPKNCSRQLRHAYCVTVHKSQGCEWQKVFVVLDSIAMACREIFYTSITRAKEAVKVYTSDDVLKRSVEHASITARKTRLLQRLLALGPMGVETKEKEEEPMSKRQRKMPMDQPSQPSEPSQAMEVEPSPPTLKAAPEKVECSKTAEEGQVAHLAILEQLPMDFKAAGIIPYNRVDGRYYLAMARKKRGEADSDVVWSDFGGKREAGENAWQTAVRELREEGGIDLSHVNLTRPPVRMAKQGQTDYIVFVVETLERPRRVDDEAVLNVTGFSKWPPSIEGPPHVLHPRIQFDKGSVLRREMQHHGF